MTKHHKHKISWVDFPERKRAIQGVYLIEDFYVGSSVNIRRRIVAHLKDCCNHKSKGYKMSPLQERMFETLQANGFIKVTFLSGNPYDEQVCIGNYSNLFNCPLKGRTYDQNF
jgi:hypothetical protein